MGASEDKEKKKKARQEKIRKASLFSVVFAAGFLQTAANYYLRQIYNIKSLLPSWGLNSSDYLFIKGDFAVLSRSVGTKILVEDKLLVIEQARQVSMAVLIMAVAYLLGKDPKERIAYLFFFGGLTSVLYQGFFYALANWPNSMVAKDVIALIPYPIVAPIYAPFLLGMLASIGGLFLLFKKK